MLYIICVSETMAFSSGCNFCVFFFGVMHRSESDSRHLNALRRDSTTQDRCNNPSPGNLCIKYCTD